VDTFFRICQPSELEILETVPRGDWSVEVGTFNFTKITREKKL